MGLENSTIKDITNTLWGDVPPYIIAIGTFGNAMSIVVLLRKNMRRPKVAVYLVSLAIADTLVLWTGLLYHWIRHKYKYDIRSEGNFGCRVTVFITANYITPTYDVWNHT